MDKKPRNSYQFFFYHDQFYAVLEFDKTGQEVVACLERNRPPRVDWTAKQDKRLQISEESRL